ncbi:MAG TPA: hypothetical protein VK177_04650 [Flavobacteriales bacterium]|nr:hypothetical protein [Flavobacteriales bacterium]
MDDIEPIKYKIIAELKESFHFVDRLFYSNTDFFPTKDIEKKAINNVDNQFRFVKKGVIKFLKIFSLALIGYYAYFFEKNIDENTKYLALVIAIIITLISLYFLIKKQAYINVNSGSITIDDNEFTWDKIKDTYILETSFSGRGGPFFKRHLLLTLDNNNFRICPLYEFHLNGAQFKMELSSWIEHFKQRRH